MRLVNASLIPLFTIALLFGMNSYSYAYQAMFDECFTMDIPDKVEITRTNQVDFVIFEFNLDGFAIMKAYLGWFPSYGNKGSRIFINNLKAKSYVSNDVKHTREVLIYLRDYDPIYLHIWYEDINETLAQICDDIIDSTISLVSTAGGDSWMRKVMWRYFGK